MPDGVMWFLILRSRIKPDAAQASSSLPMPTAADIPYYLRTNAAPANHFIPWTAAADESGLAADYQPPTGTPFDSAFATIMGVGLLVEVVAGGVVIVCAVGGCLAGAEAASAVCVEAEEVQAVDNVTQIYGDLQALKEAS